MWYTIALICVAVLLASVDLLSSVAIIPIPFCAISQGLYTASGMTDGYSLLPGSSSNRPRGCPVAFTGENRSREVPKLFLVKDRAGLLFFSSIVSQMKSVCQEVKESHFSV